LIQRLKGYYHTHRSIHEVTVVYDGAAAPEDNPHDNSDKPTNILEKKKNNKH